MAISERTRLIDAIEGTREQLGFSGQRTFREIHDQLAILGGGLDGLAHQAVRLIRALDLLGGRGGLAGALYGRLRYWESDHIAGVLTAAIRSGELAGVLAVEERSVSGRQVQFFVFPEPALYRSDRSGRVATFNLSGRQLQKVTAFVSISFELLVTELLDMTAGIRSPMPTATADAVAKDLAKAIRSVVTRALQQKEWWIRQSRSIAYFFDEVEVDPLNIDNELILSFWETRPHKTASGGVFTLNKEVEDSHRESREDKSVDGFREFRSATRNILKYCSLVEQIRGEAGEGAQDEGAQDEGAQDDEDEGANADESYDPTVDMTARRHDAERSLLATLLGLVTPPPEGSGAGRLATLTWSSPLAELFDEDRAPVKWLKSEKDVALLSQLVDAQAPASDNNTTGETPSREKYTAPLFVEVPPSEAFALTLARWVVFGDLQNRKSPGVIAVEGGYSGVRSAFEALARSGLDIAAPYGALEMTLATVGWILLSRGNAAGLLAFATLDDQIVVPVARALPATTIRLASPMDREALIAEAVLKTADNPDPAFELLRIARKGAKTTRAGFKPEDLFIQQGFERLRSGLYPLVRLVQTVGEVGGWLAAPAIEASFPRDVERFSVVFEAMYGMLLEISPGVAVQSSRKPFDAGS